jgi:hypothetical protein
VCVLLAIHDFLPTDIPLSIIPDDYDYSKTSVEVYGSTNMNFLSREQSRSRIDYNFHSNFMLQRQELHDTIVDYTLGTCVTLYKVAQGFARLPLSPWRFGEKKTPPTLEKNTSSVIF